MKHRISFINKTILGYLFFALPAYGAVIPGSAQPEQVSRALVEEEAKPTAVPSVPTVKEEEKAESPLGPEAEKIKFQFNGFIFEDNVVYSKEQLLPIYKDKLHQTISVADLFKLVQGITNYYRNNGYIISRAILPPQKIQNGVVKIQIIEGYLDEVNVSGDPKGAKCILKAYGKQIAACRPLQLKRMEHYLLIANELPATQVKAVLSPSKTKQGAANLTLDAKNSLVTGYAAYNNYGTRYIGPQQMTANLALNSFIASGDSSQMTFTKTPKGSELTFIDANYTLPIFNEGVRAFLGETRSRTRPLFVLADSKIDGINSNYYAILYFPIIRERSRYLTLQTGFNYLDSYVTSFDEPFYTDHIRTLSAGGSYNFADRWYGSNLIYVDTRLGLPILGYSSDSNPATALTSRPGGHANYFKVYGQISRQQAVKGNFSLYGEARGQYAFSALLAAEQFAFGGSIIGRGYDIAELIGDRGAAGTLEARYDWAVEKTLLNRVQFYVFYDIGVIWNVLTAPGTPKRLSGTSTGVGARMYMMKGVSGNFMWTQTLTKEVAAEELIGDGRRPRTFFSIVAELD
ncbi:MAG: hypothetical protein A3F14_06040 [Gammaproteobacteria bacterium RIFCSPHIGHO2_12_FULL_43_28]|nr:MAG: hypothetical protein A3F14_06040 [Gammaproteobacteria bacterium RIFCSPHIGHO2_12_FULL_43_28]